MVIDNQVCRRTLPKNRLSVLVILTPRSGRYLLRHGIQNCNHKRCFTAR